MWEFIYDVMVIGLILYIIVILLKQNNKNETITIKKHKSIDKIPEYIKVNNVHDYMYSNGTINPIERGELLPYNSRMDGYTFNDNDIHSDEYIYDAVNRMQNQSAFPETLDEGNFTGNDETNLYDINADIQDQGYTDFPTY